MVGILFALAMGGATSVAQAPAPLPDASQINAMVHDVVAEQMQYLQRSTSHFRYRLHRVDAKEDTLRDVIESTGGSLTRLLQHNGQALTTAENDGDRERLAAYISSGDLGRKAKDEKRNHAIGAEALQAMPDAMLYTPTAGQPQLPQHDRAQLVLDYAPNPQFHAHTTAEGLLSGLQGRLWLDAADHHLVRLEINTTRNLDLAFGMLARIYPGGTIEYDQRRVAEGVYAFSHIRMHLRLRELMVKTVPYDSDLVAADIELLTPPPTPEQAMQVLLREDVKTR